MPRDGGDTFFQGVLAFLIPGYRTFLNRRAELKRIEFFLDQIERDISMVSRSLNVFKPVLRRVDHAALTAKYSKLHLKASCEFAFQRKCKRRLGPGSQEEVDRAWAELKSHEEYVLQLFDAVRAFHDQVQKVCAEAMKEEMAMYGGTLGLGAPAVDRPTRPPFMSTPALWCIGPELIASTLALAFGATLLSTSMYGSGSCLIRQIVYRDENHRVIGLVCAPPEPLHFIDAKMDAQAPPHHPGKTYQMTITMHFPGTDNWVKLPFDGGMEGVANDLKAFAAMALRSRSKKKAKGVKSLDETGAQQNTHSSGKPCSGFYKTLPGAYEECCLDHFYYSSSKFWKTNFVPLLLARYVLAA